MTLSYNFNISQFKYGLKTSSKIDKNMCKKTKKDYEKQI